jgi:hypothetical protein
MINKRIRNALLSGCAVVALGATSANAAQLLGTGGYWSLYQTMNDQGNPGCILMTGGPLGQTAAISVVSPEPRMRFGVGKPSWKVPQGTSTTMTIRVDNMSPWNAPDARPLAGGDMLVTPIDPEILQEFARRIVYGSALHVTFAGNETPWTINLSGTGTLWPQFVACVNRTVPDFPVASLSTTAPTPTQPFANRPTQPFVPGGTAQPRPAPQPAINPGFGV